MNVLSSARQGLAQKRRCALAVAVLLAVLALWGMPAACAAQPVINPFNAAFAAEDQEQKTDANRAALLGADEAAQPQPALAAAVEGEAVQPAQPAALDEAALAALTEADLTLEAAARLDAGQVAQVLAAQEGAAALEEENFLGWLFRFLFGGGRSGWYQVGNKTYYYDPSTHKKVQGMRTIDGETYWFDNNGVLLETIRGTDVSRYQSNMDWAAVRRAGVEFVIIRAAYRGYETGAIVEDPMFRSHIEGALAAGLDVGIYFFSQATTEEEAIEEAKVCLELAQGYRLAYPIYIDSEYANSSHTGRADSLSVAQRTACVKAFCNTIEDAGYRAGVYASENWFNTRLDLFSLRRYNIWLAHYGVSQIDTECDIWQYSGTGKLPGVRGTIDLNVEFVR